MKISAMSIIVIIIINHHLHVTRTTSLAYCFDVMNVTRISGITLYSEIITGVKAEMTFCCCGPEVG
jgi:hypothetical protein